VEKCREELLQLSHSTVYNCAIKVARKVRLFVIRSRCCVVHLLFGPQKAQLVGLWTESLGHVTMVRLALGA
jgi:hypothetical protein